ncbi:MAG: nucleotide exchange factor GrpE [Syntrophomonadaceae bacterium]|nr:nucleotide exchange factor GrpE [Syntrophomonadaceae bacterium]MDD3023034.1 nucleotide exchange factor GrpE [Syntrophomonadaceae bacterium]
MNEEQVEYKNEQGEVEAEKDQQTQTPEIDEMSSLRQELDKIKQEAQKNYDLYLRTLAEMNNIKKRAAREREEYIRFATLPMIKKILPVLDDLDRALSSSHQKQDYEILSKGVEMIARSLHEAIKQEGVVAIDALHQPFDPQYHQPLTVEGSSEHPENTVIEEFQKGYTMHGRVIQPSLVKVSN